MKRIFLLCSAWVYAFAYYSNENIANELKRISLQHNIDKRVLYTLAKIESNFNPLIISFTSSHINFLILQILKRA